MVAECQNRNNQMITKEDYKNLKEYYDYQRKQAYNKEVVFAMAEKFEGRVYNDFGMVNMKDMKDLLWVRVKPEDYEEPRKGWVPQDESLRFEWEGPPNMPKTQYNGPKYHPDIDPLDTVMPSGWEGAFGDDK